MNTAQQQQQARELCSQFTVDQLTPELAADYFHKNGNPYIAFAFQDHAVQAGLMTDMEFVTRFEYHLRTAS